MALGEVTISANFGGWVVLALVWIVPVVISALKGHWALALLAFFLWLVPLAWWGSWRLAKPDSAWARRFYSPEKLARARARYRPAPQPAPRPAPAPAGPAPGTGAPSQTPTPPPAPGAQAAPAWECLICGASFEGRGEAESHVKEAHRGAPLGSSLGQPSGAAGDWETY